jgi:hypothetical protein
MEPVASTRRRRSWGWSGVQANVGDAIGMLFGSEFVDSRRCSATLVAIGVQGYIEVIVGGLRFI